MESYNQDEMLVSNPYAVASAARDNMMADQPRHESGNALAANSEARAIASVKAQVLMAKQFPRDPAYAMSRILEECKRPTLAEHATYSFPRGKETVTGPSIRLAEVMARNFGNMTFGYEVLERRPSQGKTLGTAGSSIIRAYAWDLETNLLIDRQFEVKHWRSTRSGGYTITDDRDIYELEANMSARRIRACILQMIPGDVTDAAVAACRKTASSGVIEMMANPESRAKLINTMLRIYSKMGVNQDDLEDALNAKVDNWTADHMLKLKEMKNSLEDGTVTLGDYFPRLATENQDAVVSKEQVTKLMEAAKATGYQGKVSRELKKMGIAKFADVPAARYDEVMRMIQGFGVPADETPAQIPEQPSSSDAAPPELEAPPANEPPLPFDE
ncbi:MAG: hypothetical protein IJG86_01960 [Clostridia bacterium]|nr:hypothetical protein [Clostridia bacterium]